MFGLGICFDGAENFQSIDLGKFQVQQDDFGMGFAIAPGVSAGAKEKFECLRAIPDMDDFVGQVVFVKGDERQFRIVSIVFDEEDFDFIFRIQGSSFSGFALGRVK